MVDLVELVEGILVIVHTLPLTIPETKCVDPTRQEASSTPTKMHNVVPEVDDLSIFRVIK